MNSHEVLAIIPARGGSKGIPRKNIKILKDKPLIAYTAKAALNSKYIKRVVLSTEDQEIATIGRDLGLEIPFCRDISLAKDSTPSLHVFQDVLIQLKSRESYNPDFVIILQPTSPFRTEKHIDEAIELFTVSKADSLVSVVKVPHNMNPYSVMTRHHDGSLKNFLPFNELNNQRQKKPHFYARNGAAIYITTPSCILDQNTLYGKKIICYEMDKIASLDIDDNEDWFIAERLI